MPRATLERNRNPAEAEDGTDRAGGRPRVALAGWRDGVGCAEHSLSLDGQDSALQSEAGVCREPLGKGGGRGGKK